MEIMQVYLQTRNLGIFFSTNNPREFAIRLRYSQGLRDNSHN